jgi:hypothetical protein
MPSFFRSPLYLLLALLACAFLAFADLRGWTLLQPFAGAPARLHLTPVRHK